MFLPGAACRLPTLRSDTLQTSRPHSGRPTAAEIGEMLAEMRWSYAWNSGDPQKAVAPTAESGKIDS